ncbi:hypothetical protein BZA05DRAFT_410444 [Tricharina praecox]|uniref:uncharacterized protein n=1 Tax=Tricharina praecox TaxID=43433 RepID=UPI00221F20E3|nr:uncharacterized protein BZA05DRAFT_410444 [Tricharina praecox]KAI5843721.1 hypothetical protein BZA05DRAFT_410444 [Tricharina praecox]
MPVYNNYISVPRFKRIGYHIKSTRTISTTSVFNLESGEMIMPSLSRRKFAQKSKSESAKSSKSSLKSSPDSAIDLKIESPPLVLYGPPKESSGALLSGLIHIDNEQGKEWESFTMTLLAETLNKRPVHGACSDCATQVDVINRWTFISATTTASARRDLLLSYPFSYLLPGHLPASNDNALSRISYTLVARAIAADGDEVQFKKSITVERSILPGPDRHSVRVFPPTTLSATLKLPSVVHTGSDFAIDVRLDGILNKAKNTRWRLRKVNWRIDENSKAVSPACKYHSAKLGGAGKGVAHEDIRTVGFGDIKTGWKSDFESADGKIELEIMAGIPAHTKAACQLDAANGSTVEHILVVEMIVAEEHKPAGPSRLVTPTGAARVLRMQFKLVVTARSGLGISWDEEAPPMYENVPAAPPSYGIPDSRTSFSYAAIPPPLAQMLNGV